MNKGDRLEEFVKANRSSFDDLKAPQHIWAHIDKKNRPSVTPMWKWTAVAASALLLIAVGYIFGIKTETAPEIAGWDEYLEAEKYYQARIEGKMKKIQTLPVGEEVMHDIQLLDEVYEQLRQQLVDDPNANAELVLSAMIKHQQQKLDVMEKILDRVDKYKHNENENHEM